MTDGRYKGFSVARAGLPAALALALLAAVLLPLMAMGAEAPKTPAKAPAKAPAAKPAPKPAAPKAPTAADLRSADKKARRAAAEAQVYGKVRASGAQVFDALRRETDRDIKLKLMRAAAQEGGEGAVLALVDALDWDADPLARVAAAQELGRLSGGEGAAASLAEALAHDPAVEVRRAAAASLIFYPEARALDALRAAASDADEGVRTMAGVALSRRGGGKR